jgi:tRNA pseudouridine55 synthase
VGEATKLINYMDLEWKEYQGVLVLGRITDTWDVAGRTIETREVPRFPLELLLERFGEFEGVYRQQVPVFSAVKVSGKPLYTYARRGKTVEAPFRDVTIRSFRLVRAEGCELAFDLVCGKGTYVRSIVQDLGTRLGCGACLASLRRIRSGHFRIEDARDLESVDASLASGASEGVVLPLERVLTHLEGLDIPVESERKVLNGNRLSCRDMVLPWEEQGLAARVGKKVRIRVRGRLVGIGEIRKEGDEYCVQPVRMIDGGRP